MKQTGNVGRKMISAKNLLVIVLLHVSVALFSCTQDTGSSGEHATAIPSTSDAQVTPHEKSWKRIFFTEIDSRVEGSGLGHLREREILPGDKEVRVWVGFDLYPLNGVILKETGGKWTAFYVPPIKLSSSLRPITPLSEPRSGWKVLWEGLEKLDIYTLPDAEDISALNGYPDAQGAVIEIKTNESYRTYLYGGLRTPEAPEIKKVVEICRTLSKEFGVDLLEGPKRVGIRDG